MQVPAGRMAELYGAKWIIATSLIGSGVINVITPLIADYVVLLTISRVTLGVLQGGVFPGLKYYHYAARMASLIRFHSSVDSMLRHDIEVVPLFKERSVAFTFLDLGGTSGAMLGASVAGYMSEHGKLLLESFRQCWATQHITK